MAWVLGRYGDAAAIFVNCTVVSYPIFQYSCLENDMETSTLSAVFPIVISPYARYAHPQGIEWGRVASILLPYNRGFFSGSLSAGVKAIPHFPCMAFPLKAPPRHLLLNYHSDGESTMGSPRNA